uniref:Uncharacterized protein n=1 Tax=Mycena chlorophos TaxID=658473 RepID=A0ABQ0LPJ8_MYCCL|nr:predicted protein [Mycena chlorophos]
MRFEAKLTPKVHRSPTRCSLSSVDLHSSRTCKSTLSASSSVPTHAVPRRRKQRQSTRTGLPNAFTFARFRRLPRAASFFWDGSELPGHDSVWATLRACCAPEQWKQRRTSAYQRR